MFQALEFTATLALAAERWTLERANAFIDAAVELSGLNAIHRIGGDYDGNIMLLQLIAESHIAVHLMKNEEPEPYGAIHVFSCRDFDRLEMARLAAEFFVEAGGPIRVSSLPRGDLLGIDHVLTS